MMHIIEMSSDALKYVPNSIKIGLAIQKLIGGIHLHPHRHTNTHTDNNVIS
jgi:hypothetical protein